MEPPWRASLLNVTIDAKTFLPINLYNPNTVLNTLLAMMKTIDIDENKLFTSRRLLMYF